MKRWQIAACLWFCLAVAGAPGVKAACPASPPGQQAPPQTQADYLDNPSWRSRVAAVDRELTGLRGSRSDLVFLGDSITEAWDPELFAANFGRYGALNLGVRGDTTQGMLWRLPRLGLGSKIRPALIVLLIGTNNTWPNGNAPAVALGIAEVVQSIRTLSPASRILLVGILPRGPNANDPWRLMGGQVNRLIATCADSKTIFYTDPGRGLIEADGKLSQEIAGDYLHPTARGYAVLSDAIKKDIRALLR